MPDRVRVLASCPRRVWQVGALSDQCSTTSVVFQDTVILREPGQSASELHDTVAYHVSAIIVQAERIASESNPDASVDVLAIIKEVPIANAVGHVSLRTS